jgi:hypothetical protein
MRNVSADDTVFVANSVMVSPFTIPALAAGDDGTTATTRAPGVVGVVVVVDVEVGGDVAGANPAAATSTPRNPPRPMEGDTRGGSRAAVLLLAGAVALPPQTLYPMPRPSATIATPASSAPMTTHGIGRRRGDADDAPGVGGPPGHPPACQPHPGGPGHPGPQPDHWGPHCGVPLQGGVDHGGAAPGEPGVPGGWEPGAP